MDLNWVLCLVDDTSMTRIQIVMSTLDLAHEIVGFLRGWRLQQLATLVQTHSFLCFVNVPGYLFIN